MAILPWPPFYDETASAVTYTWLFAATDGNGTFRTEMKTLLLITLLACLTSGNPSPCPANHQSGNWRTVQDQPEPLIILVPRFRYQLLPCVPPVPVAKYCRERDLAMSPAKVAS